MRVKLWLSTILSLVSTVVLSQSNSGYVSPGGVGPSSAAFVNTGGLIAYYPLTEGTGTTLNDAAHGLTSTIAGTTVPTWTADGALSYTTATSATLLSTSIQNVQTIEIAVAGLAVANATAVNVIMSYTNTNPAMSLSTYSDYIGSANPGVGIQGATNKWLTYHIIPVASQYSLASVVDNGLHILAETYNSTTGAVSVYLDGQLTVLGDQSPATTTGLPSGGTWALGNGEPIGNSNCGSF
jgi:hypothetical protein